MAQYFDFQPNSLTAFSFPALLDGVQYNAVVTWNIFGLRWYLNLYSTQGTLVYSTPVVESPDGFDVSLLPKSFTSVLVFRDSTKQFEVWDTPNTYPDFNAVPDWMLDSTLGKFVLDSSSMLANDVMFDAAGNPIILNQSTLQSEAMLDAMGGQFVLGPSSQVNQGTAVVTFANAPLTGAILTAVDALNNAYALGTGDGITQKFQTNPNVQLTLPAKIYKQDWQGNQLQYSTPRTNYAFPSADLNAKWTVRGTGSVTYGQSAPDGSSNAVLISVNQQFVNDVYSTVSGLTNGQRYEPAFWIKKTTASGMLEFQAPQGGNGWWAIDFSKIGSGWERITRNHPAVTVNGEFVALSGGEGFLFWPGTAFTTMVFTCYDFKIEPGTVSTSSVVTTTAPVTVTDYAETDGGSILASTQDLSSQAMLTGQGSNVTLDQSTIP